MYKIVLFSVKEMMELLWQIRAVIVVQNHQAVKAVPVPHTLGSVDLGERVQLINRLEMYYAKIVLDKQ